MLTACCLAVAGCKKKQTAAGGPGGFAVQVVAVEAKRQPVSESLSLVGTLAANEMVEIKSEADGTVAQINFNEGERVEQGRLLIKLDESKLAASAAEAEANFKLSQANFDRTQQLFKDHHHGDDSGGESGEHFDEDPHVELPVGPEL
ncbi:MAG: efflux RND transporter periplasmic adaptor subunit, partial [Phycisphaerales bacterium]|nr:efflux RND transporter periplasmic adaptor subunit [Phycisphaerales bacterium]